MPLALIPLIIPLAGLTAGGFWLRHMHERHGPGPLLWRFCTGMPLDGHPRTNATWLHRSSDVLHHTGHAIWWHHLPRLSRAGIRCGTGLACLGICAGLVLDFAVTALVLACLAAAGVAWGAYRAARGLRNLRFYLRWIWPLKRTLALWFGVPPKLRIAPDRSHIKVSLPQSWAGTQREQDKLVSIITSKTGIEVDPDKEEDVAWRTQRRAPYVTFNAASPPPREALLTSPQVLELITSCGPADVMAGLGCRGREVIRSVDTDSPHLGVSMGSGDGKSVTAGNATAQLLAKGAFAGIADIKIISHRWAKGLPNVAYATRPHQIHQLLTWLAAHVEERNAIVDAHADIYGRVRGAAFPRLVFIAEELNATQKKLSAWWRECRAEDRSLPARCPSVDALEMLLYLGRQVNVNVIAIGQRLSAASVSGAGGNADARENLGLRWMCDPGPATWRMLGPETPCPRPRDIPGRYYLVSRKEALEMQGVYGDPSQFRRLAVSGEIAVPPDDMPFVHRAGDFARADDDGWTWKAEAVPVPELVAAGGPRTAGNYRTSRSEQAFVPGQADPVLDAELVGEAVQAGAQDERVTLREGRDLGIVKVNLSAAQRRSTRDPKHPRPVGRRGPAFEYDAIDLADYYARAA